MDFSKFSRRDFFRLAGAGIAASTVSKVAMAALPEIVSTEHANTQAPLLPSTGRPYNPVVTLNGWSLPWRMNNGVKEFHLVAEPVLREIAPGMKAHLWGYNGQSPGPTIEVVEGDRVRIFVTNRLPEITSVHWHGQPLPNGMDGVAGLTQSPIPPGKTFVYEFEAKRAGTFMYHPHADEMAQMAMGMMGSWITHPKNPKFMPVDRDFVFLLNSYDIDPGSYTPKVSTMLDFNLWTFNSRAFPGTAPLAVRKNDRVRKVETRRFVQRRTDNAYEDGLSLLKAGRLSPRLSEQEALGNYIDRRVREELRERYARFGIDSAGKGPVRVNRREDDSSGTDTTYRRPDARVKDVAFDVTLTRKTLGTAQVRGFFSTDFRPSRVVIIRPRQLGANHTYVIARPETKR